MRSLSVCIIALALGMSPRSHAADAPTASADSKTASGSEYLHQADRGRTEFTVGLGREEGKTAWTVQDPNGIAYQTISYRGQSEKTNITMFPISASVERGLSARSAIGLDLIYGSGKITATNCPSTSTCNGSSKSGLYNPTLYYKGNSTVGTEGAIVYGAMANIGLEKSKTDSDQNENVASGGSTLTPYFGYQSAVGAAGHAGARVQYDLYKGDRKSTVSDNPDQNITVSHGNKWALDAFLESNFDSFMLGASVAYMRTAETTAVSAGQSSKQADSSNTWIFEVYAPVYSDGLVVLPNIAYEMENYTQSIYKVASVNTIQFGVAGRF